MRGDVGESASIESISIGSSETEKIVYAWNRSKPPRSHAPEAFLRDGNQGEAEAVSRRTTPIFPMPHSGLASHVVRALH